MPAEPGRGQARKGAEQDSTVSVCQGKNHGSVFGIADAGRWISGQCLVCSRVGGMGQDMVTKLSPTKPSSPDPTAAGAGPHLSPRQQAPKPLTHTPRHLSPTWCPCQPWHRGVPAPLGPPRSNFSCGVQERKGPLPPPAPRRKPHCSPNCSFKKHRMPNPCRTIAATAPRSPCVGTQRHPGSLRLRWGQLLPPPPWGGPISFLFLPFSSFLLSW